MTSLLTLAEKWEHDAELLDGYGASEAAAAARLHAQQLRDAVRSAEHELLTPDEAAEASGYSKRRLRELVDEGKLENVGEKHRPRYRRGDLPTKPGAPTGTADGFDAGAEARRILGAR